MTFAADRRIGGGRLLGIGAAPLLFSATAAIFLLALILGGGTRQGLWSDAVVQIACLPLFAGLVRLAWRDGAIGLDRRTLLLVAAVLFLPLLQLIRLPPSWWSLLPGRTLLASGYAAAGVALPWLPISLDPAATWRAALSLLPPLAVFLATLRLGLTARRTLVVLAIAVGLTSVFLGLAQLMPGPASPLRFFPIANSFNSVGFFANRNHYSALLYSVVPFTAAWLVGLLFDQPRRRFFAILVCLLIYVGVILGLGMALSRAGIFLAVVAALASLLMAAVRQERLARYGLIIMGGAILVGTLLVLQFALFNLLGKFDNNLLADYRVWMARLTIAAAATFQPAGSGFGTFVPVYQMFEVPEALIPSYVNHAHNDWLELWLEGGWPALAVLTAALVWFGAAAVRVWRAPGGGARTIDRALPQAASLVVILLLVHSLVDYPLHTTALMTLFAFCCALLVPPIRPREPVAGPSRRAHSIGRRQSTGTWAAARAR